MTKKQKHQFNIMLQALKIISKGNQSADQITRNAQKEYGLDCDEALAMSYENIQNTARTASRGVQEIKTRTNEHGRDSAMLVCGL